MIVEINDTLINLDNVCVAEKNQSIMQFGHCICWWMAKTFKI